MAPGTDAAAAEAAPGAAAGEAGFPQAPEEVVETQLRGILEVTQTSAGAVCLFDQHQELLRLAVEVGLSDEGCRRLRNVRRGAATTWDMPLHSLLNRRAYLIESAAKNRYVPPLVENVSAVRAVACIPLYDGSTPVGSLILVALAPKTFGERQVRLLEQPVRNLVSAIVAMRQRVTHAAPAAPAARPSLSAASPAKPALGDVRVAGPISPEIKSAPGQPASGAGAASADMGAAIERARAELERLRARLTETEAAAAAERERADRLAAEHEDVERRAGEMAAELERLRAAVAELEQARAGESALHDELERLRANHEAQARELEIARTAEREIRAELDAVHAAKAADAEAAHEHLTTTEELRSRIAELEATTTLLRAQLTEHDESRRAALADRDGRLTEAAAETTAWRERYETAELALAQVREHETALTAQLATLQAELEHTRHEEHQLRENVARLEASLPLGEEPASARAAPAGEAFDLNAAGAFEVVALDTAEGTGEAPLAQAPEPTTALPLVETQAAERGDAAGARDVVVLDGDGFWNDAAPADLPLTVVAPTADPAAIVRTKRPERLIVNLAAHEALGALAAVRAAGCTTPCVACIAVPGQTRGLVLGRFEIGPRPIDPDTLLARLRADLPRGTRVVTAGADVDGLISLRQALARLGVSVSMAWDAKQTGELLAMVRPEVAILDLELPPKDGCGIVARIGLATPTPFVVVIPKPTDTAAAFAAALAHPELARATVPAKELLSALVRIRLGRAEAGKR